MTEAMKDAILAHLPQRDWQEKIHWFDTLDSTNNEAKRMAAAGAPDGTLILSAQQTVGRGRMGRSFQSPAGMGVYVSLLMRPMAKPEQLMHLTCAAGLYSCRGVWDAAGFQPKIKWINDLIAGKRKLGGILTEMSVSTATGLVEYAIVGVGINCRQTPQDFPPELRDKATSLLQATGEEVSLPRLAAAMVLSLTRMNGELLTRKKAIMEGYKGLCITLHQPVQLLRGEECTPGYALDLDEDGGLIVSFPDGSLRTVNSGEVSVRGMYGYL